MGDDVGSQYDYLLQPIKDLCKNFDIDISSELGIYRKRMQAALGITQNENNDKEIFSEAATLIQGTTMVYGRKVDLLEDEARNFNSAMAKEQDIAMKKKGGKNDQEAVESVDEDDDDGMDGDDDVLIDPYELFTFEKLLGPRPSCDPFSLLMKESDVEEAVIPTVSRIPISLRKRPDFEKSEMLLIGFEDGKKKILGKKEDFKLNTVFINRNGLMLVDPDNKALRFVVEKDGYIYDDDDVKTEAVDTSFEQPLQPQCVEGIHYINGVDSDMDVLPIGDGRPSTEIEAVRKNRSTGIGLLLDRNEGNELTKLQENYDEDDGFGIFDNSVSDSVIIQDITPQLKPWEEVGVFEADPYELIYLNEYEQFKYKSRPYEEEKRYIHHSLKKKIEKVRSETKTSHAKIMETIDYVNENFYRRSTKLYKGKHDWPYHALHRYIVREDRERRHRERKAKAKAQLSILAEHREVTKKKRNNVENVDRLARNTAGMENIKNYDNNDDDDWICNNDEGGGFSSDDEPELANLSHGERYLYKDIRENIQIPTPVEADNSSSSGGSRLEREKARNMDHGEVEELPPDPEKMSSEEIVKWYLERWWIGSRALASKIAARVEAWKKEMAPILKREEERPPFEIHEYGNEMLNKFEEVGDSRLLPELLTDVTDRAEVSRCFLAILMMANTSNLEISSVPIPGLENQTNMKVKLLKKDRHHDIFNQEGAF